MLVMQLRRADVDFSREFSRDTITRENSAIVADAATIATRMHIQSSSVWRRRWSTISSTHERSQGILGFFFFGGGTVFQLKPTVKKLAATRGQRILGDVGLTFQCGGGNRWHRLQKFCRPGWPGPDYGHKHSPQCLYRSRSPLNSLFSTQRLLLKRLGLVWGLTSHLGGIKTTQTNIWLRH